ncbi:uncharacterized protein LY79DRAFT_586677 [Colletotrichum navitas]|uniref:Protein kinase domain-containing protein n=1 Tax=Colletotrichum navitas TaxID=681940 RepID=A0AAD8VBN4_9PEZI|nr:uncharacterized protein LY79DRAFT_586677 [Colletotrichum navitas]KAK1598655.1 hypothetical protein LY79DRAFT_586677 [Colletotrichum navitas]
MSSSSEDQGALYDHEWIYSRGRRLTLVSHRPLAPYGSHVYPLPGTKTDMENEGEELMLSEDEKAMSVTQLVFAPGNEPQKGKTFQNDKNAEMEVQIADMVCGSPGLGYSPGPQNLKCYVTKAPTTSPIKGYQLPTKGQLLFLKVFDPLFWYKALGYSESEMKVTRLADSSFSDEFGAYQFLHEKGLAPSTLLLSHAPDFFGGWTANVTSLNEKFSKKSRPVAVLTLEYIEGVSMKGLFTPLGPTRGTVNLYQDQPSTRRSFETDQDQRMEILSQLLHGIASQEKLGLDNARLDPINVILTVKYLKKPMQKPRAVLVGYGGSIVDHLRTEPVEMWKDFPKKVHPFTRFSWEVLEDLGFVGWIPTEWRPDNDDEGVSCDLDLWMLNKFGSIRNIINTEYTTWPEKTPEAEEASTGSEEIGTGSGEQP